MLPAPRTTALTLLAGFVLLAAGCGSNNTGKLVGKWRATEGDVVGATYFEFTADGRFELSVDLGKNEGAVETVKGKYSLGSGDWVELSDVTPALDGKTQSREKITVSGDTMRIDGEDGKALAFTRVN